MADAPNSPAANALSVRRFHPDDTFAARDILAKAFAGEPFAFVMHGDSPIDRLAGFRPSFDVWPRAETTLAVVATISGSVVGVASAAVPGTCMVCAATPEPPAADAPRSEWLDHEFLVACRQAHHDAQLPAHFRVGPVAVDPFLHGAGVGRVLMAALLDEIRAIDPTCVVLECLTTREAFYEHLGFRRLADFEDTASPSGRSVLMRLDA